VVNKKSSSKTLLTVVVGLWAGVILGAVVIGLLAWSGVIPLFNNGAGEDDQPSPQAALESGTIAPDFEVDDLSGNRVKLSGFRGKVVLMNYWATWCGPCVREMPTFQEYQERFPSNLVVVGVNEEERAEQIQSFFEKTGMQITYPILLDLTTGVGAMYKVNFLPTTFLIDEKGEIRFRHYGVMSREQIEYYLKTLGVIQE
jgi:peroxiredoxin